MRLIGKTFPVIPVALLCVTCAGAQEYRGTLSGTVTDPSGAVIPGASVMAKSGEQTYNVKADGSGRFVIPFAQPNTYEIRVSAPGFTTEVFPKIVLQTAATVDVPVKLTVTGDTSVVTVSTDQFLISTTDASGGTVIDPEKVQNLPLNGRQVYQLLQLTPGVRFTQTQFGAGGFSGNRAWDTNNSYQISGQPGSTNQFLLNGAPISIQSGGPSGTWTIAPTVDAVQEVKVMTITFDAQYGRAGGGIINTTLKGGTNRVHGTAYDYWQNSFIEANTYQSNQNNTAKSFHNRHQYGGTVGGPVWRNSKAFAFFSHEGWREVLPAPVLTTVPTADLTSVGPSGGIDLTNYLISIGHPNGIYDPLTTYCAVANSSGNGCTTYGRLPFANNIIPANRISPIGLRILKLFPAPNLPTYQNNYIFNGKDRYSYDMPIGRFDYNFSDRTKFYGILAYWSGQEYRNNNGLVGAAINGNIDNQRSDWTGVLDLTHSFSNTIVGDIRGSFNRYNNPSPDGTVAAGLASLTPADLGLSMPTIPTSSRSLAPEFNVGENGFPTVVGNTVGATIFETYDLGPSITQTIRRHSLHYGGEFSLYHDVTGGVGQPNGNFGFGTGFTQYNYAQGNQDGSALADVLLGYPNGGSVQWLNAPYESYKYYGFFFQDNYKVNNKLAINAGIRWDEERSPVERHNRLLAGINLTASSPLNGLINFPAGNLLPNGAQISNPIRGAIQYASSSNPAYLNNTGFWQPKLGLSFAPNSNFVVHAGYTLGKAFGIELGGASPFSQTTSYNSTSDGGKTPNTFFRDGNPFPNGAQAPAGTNGGPTALTGNGIGFDAQDRKIPIVQQWTLGIQQQMPAGIVLKMDYLGTHTYHLRASKQLNGLNPVDFAKGHANPNYLDQDVTNPFYGVLPSQTYLGSNPRIPIRYLMVNYPQFGGDLYEYTNPQGYSNYHSLLISAEKRLSGSGTRVGGISVLGSFTWAKLMSANGFLNNNAVGLTDPQPYYGIDGGDRPWTIAFSGLWDLPLGRGRAFLSDTNRVVDAAISGWQLDFIVNDQAGTPIGFPNGYNYGCGTYQIRSTHRTYSSYINNDNPQCFKTFTEYTAVTQSPNTTQVRTPYAPQESLGLEKKFAITEKVNFQFKVESFNATNTPIFGGPDTGNPNQAVVDNHKGLPFGTPGAFHGYGTIGSTQQNFPRQYQFSGKILF